MHKVVPFGKSVTYKMKQNCHSVLRLDGEKVFCLKWWKYGGRERKREGRGREEQKKKKKDAQKEGKKIIEKRSSIIESMPSFANTDFQPYCYSSQCNNWCACARM